MSERKTRVTRQVIGSVRSVEGRGPFYDGGIVTGRSWKEMVGLIFT